MTDDERRTAHGAGHEGWEVLTLDTTGVRDKAGLLDRVQRDLHLPGWFGHNWDALADCLSDLSHPVGTLVVWTGWGDLAEADPTTFATAREVFEERVEARGTSKFALLLDDVP